MSWDFLQISVESGKAIINILENHSIGFAVAMLILGAFLMKLFKKKFDFFNWLFLSLLILPLILFGIWGVLYIFLRNFNF